MNVTCFQYNIHRPSISISTPPSSVNSAPPQSISYLSAAVNPPLDLCQLLWLITCQARHREREQMLERDIICEKTTSFLGGGISFFLLLLVLLPGRTQRRLSPDLFIFLFLLEPRPRTAVDRVGGLKYLVVDSRTFGVLYHMRGGLRHETFITRRNSAQFSFFFLCKVAVEV